jgi:hypothetical protein
MPSPKPWTARTTEGGQWTIVDATGKPIPAIFSQYDPVMHGQRLSAVISQEDAETIVKAVNARA